MMEAIKSTLEDKPNRVNLETRKQRVEQAKQVIQYLNETEFAVILERKKREQEALTYEEKIRLWQARAENAGYKEVDARVSYNNQIDNLTF